MNITCYLAMTGAEYTSAEVLPEHPAWMAGYFSGSGNGLSNLPLQLSSDTLLILNDRFPPHGHDPQWIVWQLTQLLDQLPVWGILLDFQRPNYMESAKLAEALVREIPCPVCVSEPYSKDLDCPVFLPPPPLHQRLSQYLAPWEGREIWLEAATDAETITVTKEGSIITPLADPPAIEPSFEDTNLFCRYQIDVSKEHAVFTLVRDKALLEALLEESESLGVTKAVGLYQQMGIDFSHKT